MFRKSFFWKVLKDTLFLIFRDVFWKKSCHFRNLEQKQEIDLSFFKFPKITIWTKTLIISFTWKQREVSIILRNKKKKYLFPSFFFLLFFSLKKRETRQHFQQFLSFFFFEMLGKWKGFFFSLAVHSFVFSKISFLKPKKIASQKKEAYKFNRCCQESKCCQSSKEANIWEKTKEWVHQKKLPFFNPSVERCCLFFLNAFS